MEIQSLETFVTIVQQGSFSKAAEKLGYTQAAVTIQIKKLEKELEVCLFDRLGRRTSLTSSGKIFYQHSIDILNSITRAKEAVDSKEELHGELYIGTIDSLCSFVMHPLLGDFHKKYPSVKIRIVTDTINELMDKLNNNDVDLLYIADEKRSISDWIKIMEKEEKCLFVASPNHPLSIKSAKKKAIALEELLSYPFILTEKNASYRQLLDLHLEEKGLEIIPYLESTNPNLILNMLAGGDSISLLPTYVVKEQITQGILQPIHVKNTQISIWHQVYYHKNKWITKEMDAFINAIAAFQPILQSNPSSQSDPHSSHPL